MLFMTCADILQCFIAKTANTRVWCSVVTSLVYLWLKNAFQSAYSMAYIITVTPLHMKQGFQDSDCIKRTTAGDVSAAQVKLWGCFFFLEGRSQKDKRSSRGRGRRTSEEDTPKKKKLKGG